MIKYCFWQKATRQTLKTPKKSGKSGREPQFFSEIAPVYHHGGSQKADLLMKTGIFQGGFGRQNMRGLPADHKRPGAEFAQVASLQSPGQAA